MIGKPQLNGKIPFWIITMIIFSVWLRIGWVMFYPYVPAKIHGKITVSPRVVMAGEQVFYTVDYEKFMDCEAVVTKMIVNERVFHFTPVPQQFPTGRRIFTKPLTVPLEAHGTARIYFAISYPVSTYPERKVIVTAWSEPFDIIAPDPPEYKQGKTGPKGEPGKGFWGK